MSNPISEEVVGRNPWQRVATPAEDDLDLASSKLAAQSPLLCLLQNNTGSGKLRIPPLP